jgi:class 3 adenylate cyclase
MADERQIRISLATKFAVMISLLILVSMTLVTIFSITNEISTANQVVRGSMAQLVGTLQYTRGHLTDEQLDSYLQKIYGIDLSSARYHARIMYILVVDNDDKALTASLNPQASIPGKINIKGKEVELAELVRTDAKARESVIRSFVAGKSDAGGKMEKMTAHLSTPAGRKFGDIHIGYSLLGKKAAIQKNIHRNVIFTLIMILFGLFISIIISKSLTRSIGKLVAGMDKVADGILDTRVDIKSQDEIGWLGRNFNAMTEGLQRGEKVRRVFTSYVTKQVADKLIGDVENGTLAMKGEKRMATILFADIRGFSTMAEKMPPEEQVELLNEYFGAIVNIVFRYEGTLDKFIGDCVMAVWGAPYYSDDSDALLAVKAAMAMQMEINVLNEKRVKEGKIPLRIGIGLSSGEVVAGLMGSEECYNYTVIGDDVNMAERLQALADNQRVLISDNTYEEIKDEVEVIEMGMAEVKGKKEASPIYQVLSLKGAGLF